MFCLAHTWEHIPHWALLYASPLFSHALWTMYSLSRSNENIAWAAHDSESFRKLTIRLVQSGTFGDFRQLKLDEGNVNLGQVKVPVVLPKAAYVRWFSSLYIIPCRSNRFKVMITFFWSPNIYGASYCKFVV